MLFQLIMLIPFLLIGTAFFAIKRFMDSFSEEYGSNNQTNVNAYKSKVISVDRKYKSDTKFHIELIKENWFTKLLKFTGFSKELQTGFAQFDNYFYIVADDPRTCDIITAQDELQHKLYTLAKTIDNNDWEYVKLISDGSYVQITLKPKKKLELENFNENDFNKELDKHMHPIVDILADPIITSNPAPNSNVVKLILRASIVLSSIATILFVYILFTLRYPNYVYIDINDMFISIAFISSGVVFLYISYILKFFRGQTRIYALLIHPTLAIFFSTFLSFYIFTRFSNIYFDHSTKQFAACTIENKEVHRPRRGANQYILTITHPYYYQESLDIHVPAEFYNEINVNHQVEIGINEGYWGFEWISSISSTLKSSTYLARKIRTKSIF